MKVDINRQNKLLIILCSLLIYSCPSPMQAPSPEKLPKGFGSFSLSVDAQRTILPGVALSDFAAYTLEFTAVSGGTDKTENRTNANLASPPIILAVGTYDLIIRAYRDAEKNRLAARGTEMGIIIADGAAVSKTVTLKAIGDDGSGTFTWNINITASDVTSAVMAISSNGTAISGSPKTLNLSGETDGSLTLNSGKYNIKFTLIKDGVKEEAVWNEILYIYAELTSDFTFTFDNDFFYQTHYTVTFVYNDDGVTANDFQSVMHGNTLTRPANPARRSHSFADWHTDSTLSVPYVFTTPVYNNFSLYAKWEWDIYVAVADFAAAAADMIIYVPHNITMGNNLTIPANSGRTLTITSASGGPYVISRGRADTTTDNGLFIVAANANLILQDIILDGKMDEYSNNQASLVRLLGAFTMESGAVLKNNRAYNGGAVNIPNSTGAVFTMNGGEISGNTATSRGGGVYQYYGTVNIYGGSIINNISNTGGGIYVDYSPFRLGGDAVIMDNKRTNNTTLNNVYLSSYNITLGTGGNVPKDGMTIYAQTTRKDGVIISSGATDPLVNYFFPDEDGKGVVCRNGRLLIIPEEPVVSDINISGWPIDSVINLAAPEIFEGMSPTTAQGWQISDDSTSWAPFSMPITADMLYSGKYLRYFASNDFNGVKIGYSNTSVIRVLGAGEYEITIQMWDRLDDAWDTSAALRINVNGTNISPNARIERSESGRKYFFVVRNHDDVKFYWVNGGTFDYECAFAVYYSLYPPVPDFNPNTGSWSQSANDPDGNVLLYKQYANSGMGNFGNGTLMGSFIVSLGIQAGFVFDMTDPDPQLDSGIVIYRSNNTSARPRSVTLTAPDSFTNPAWYWNGNLLSSASSVTLDADNSLYGNLIGKKFLTLEAMVDGKPYSRTISFRVEP